MSLPKNIDQSKSNLLRRSAALNDEPTATVCTRVTGSGRSAIAVVAVRGSDAQEMVWQCFEGARKSRFSPSEIRYGLWTGPSKVSTSLDSDGAGESVVITPLSEDQIEIHCHGGTAATNRIIDDLQACGATRIESNHWVANSENLLVREATQALSRCVTAPLAAIAMDQVRGAMRDWATKLLEDLENEVVNIELARCEAANILTAAPLTTRLAKAFQVVLSGPPNVGKSSLLNAMVGFDRSITLDVAGTTRDVLHAETVINGLPIRLSDTAGIRVSEESVEKQGVARALVAAEEADLVLQVSEPPVAGDTHESVPLGSSDRVIRVLNKSDLLDGGDLINSEIATNALTGDGVRELMDLIADRLSSEMPRPGQPAAVNDRQAGLLDEMTRAMDTNQVASKLRELLGIQ